MMRPIGATALESGEWGVSRRLEVDWVFREQLRIAFAILGISLTLGLAWLVVHEKPLPFADLRTSAIATVIFCVLSIGLVLYLQRLPLVSFPALFLVVTFLFTCSPLILYVFEGLDAFRFWEFVDTRSVLVAMPVVALAFSSFLVGATLIPKRRPSVMPGTVRMPAAVYRDPHTLKMVAYVTYGISALFIVGFTLSGSALTFAFQGGYAELHGAKRAGEISQLAASSMTHLLPWSLLMLTATSRDRRSRRVVLLLAIPAIAITLASGDRSTALPTIVLIASGMYLLGSRIGWRRSLGIAAVVAFLIPTVLNLRQVPISEWSGEVLRESATNQVESTHTFQKGILDGFLISMSTSYSTLMATVMAVPQQEGFHYGADYLSSLLVAVPFHAQLLPSLGAEIDRFEPSQWVMTILHPGRTTGAGYLQLAEAYLEFGAIGVIGLYMLLGWGLIRLWRFASARALDPQVVAFSLILMMETLIWVRNTSIPVVRAFAWGWLLVYALPALLRSRSGSASPRMANRTARAQGGIEP